MDGLREYYYPSAPITSHPNTCDIFFEKKIRMATPKQRDPLRTCFRFTKNNYVTLPVIDRDPAEVQYCIEGKEIAPSTGTPHIQGFVMWRKQKRMSQLIKAYPGMDWGHTDGTPWENFTYCSKDGDFEEYGERPPTKFTRDKKAKESADAPFAEAFAAPTVREGIEIIKAKRPRDLALHGESIERNLKRSKQPVYVPQYTMEQFIKPPINPIKSVLLAGTSNCGKTHYATAHFTNPLVCSHIDQLKQLSPDNDGVVFDDMSFKHWPPESVIHLLDYDFDRTINVRYGTVTIPRNTKKIFTHNTENPFYDPAVVDEQQRNAIERRLTRIVVNDKLY